MQGGFGHYLSRRARRILPPYYVALVLSIGLIAAYNAIAARRGLVAPVDSALTPGAIGSHLLLFHNLTWDWAYRINGPMWSVATEWQIYFLFPAILLPLCRGRGGVFVTVGVAWLLGSLPQIFLPAEASFFWACPWFIGSFALGMMVAVIGCSPQFRESPWRKQVPWGTLTLLFLGVLVVLTATGRAERWPLLVVDIFVSAFAACWIGACVNRAEADAESFMLRILGSRPMVALAGFSYSLYLVQHPILRFSEKVVDRLPLRFDANIGVHLLVVAPLIMAIAWLFSELFEKPFTTGGLLFRSRVRAASMAAPQLT